MNPFLLPPYLAPFSPSVGPAMKRFALGILCLAVYAVFGPYFPDNYFLTDEYEVRMRLCSNKTTLTACDTIFPHYLKCKTLSFPQAQPFWYRCVFILLWAKIILYKYVSCWVIAVSCLLTCKHVQN